MATTIHFFNGTDNNIENHYFQKEYRDDIIVENNGKFYEVYFFTKDALEYEMNKDGFFSLPGLIIVEEITLSKLLSSINYLLKIKYFDQFTGYNENPINNRFTKRWYEERGSFFTKDKLKSLDLM